MTFCTISVITSSCNTPGPQHSPCPRSPPCRVSRKDGWTPDRQRAFIAHLAATGSVTAATSAVGLSNTQAYRLRSAPGAGEFAAAWDAALDCGIAALKALAFDRAVNGVPVMRFWRGEPRSSDVRHDNRILMALLRHYDRPLAPGSVGGKAVPVPVAQVRPTDVAEQLFQTTVAMYFDFQRRIRVNDHGLEVLRYAKAQGLDFVVSVLTDQNTGWRESNERRKPRIDQGPDGFRELAAQCGKSTPWFPLSDEALAEVARVRRSLVG